MRIYNKENIITNKQIEKCIQKYNKDIDFGDIKIIVSEKRNYIFDMKFLSFVHRLTYYFANANSEGAYTSYHNLIFINLYNLDGSVEDKRLYGVGVLIHEIKHMAGDRCEEDCDNEAIRFLNRNSKFLKEILKLKREYTIEEF